MIKTEAVDAVVELPVAVRVGKISEKAFVVLQDTRVAQVDGRYLAGDAVIPFERGDPKDDGAWFPMLRIIEQQVAALPPGVVVGYILRLHVDRKSTRLNSS